MRIYALILASALLMLSCETGTKEESHDDIVPMNEGLRNEDGETVKPTEGAANPEMLAHEIFQALKSGAFTLLSDNIPSDPTMNEIYITGSRDTGSGELPPLTKGQEVMAAELRSAFEQTIKEGRQAGIDWVTAKQGTLHFDTEEKDRFMIAHLTIPVLAEANDAYIIEADAIKVNNKWYLMNKINLASADSKAVH